jgi:hypothetical protein
MNAPATAVAFNPDDYATASLDLTEKAMLMDLTIKVWAGRKLDKKTTEELCNAKNAARGAARVNKVLLPDNPELKAISSAAGAIKKFHKAMTLPWDDYGKRILLSANYFTYREGLKKRREEFDQAVNALIIKYAELLRQAPVMLGDLYNEADYPQISEIRDKFDVVTAAEPFPSSKDFRVAISKEEIKSLQADIHDRIMARVQAGMQDLWARLFEPVKKMAETLSDQDAGFQKSLVENVVAITELLPKLNLLEDPDLERMRQEIQRKLCGVTAKELKASGELRDKTAEEATKLADAMLSKMGWMAK